MEHPENIINLCLCLCLGTSLKHPGSHKLRLLCLCRQLALAEKCCVNKPNHACSDGMALDESKFRYCSLRDGSFYLLYLMMEYVNRPAGSGVIECCNGWIME